MTNTTTKTQSDQGVAAYLAERITRSDPHARLDNWCDGALDGSRNTQKRSDDPDYLDGYAEGRRSRTVRVAMPERPEGYYHMPLATA